MSLHPTNPLLLGWKCWQRQNSRRCRSFHLPGSSTQRPPSPEAWMSVFTTFGCENSLHLKGVCVCHYLLCLSSRQLFRKWCASPFSLVRSLKPYCWNLFPRGLTRRERKKKEEEERNGLKSENSVLVFLENVYG